MFSNIVELFNAKAFAERLKDSFGKSRFKTQAEFIKAVKSNKATVSRLMNASKQTVTDKPSQPQPELVVRIADAFKESRDEWLVLAGYAPTKTKETRAVNTALKFDRLPQTEQERLSLLLDFLDKEIEKIEQGKK